MLLLALLATVGPEVHVAPFAAPEVEGDDGLAAGLVLAVHGVLAPGFRLPPYLVSSHADRPFGIAVDYRVFHGILAARPNVGRYITLMFGGSYVESTGPDSGRPL